MLHQCHPNRYNLHNQVGLVALSCYGTPYAPLGPPASAPATAPSLDAFEPTIRDKIQEIMAKKDQAVEQEDFDSAKQYKQAVDQLMAVAPHLTELDNRKRLAIQHEDFDSAKIIKQEIERVRQVTFA